MFGKKCTLCGGKLDERGICTECGLDSNKSEKNYQVNQASCDGMPMTHIHEERMNEQKRKTSSGAAGKKPAVNRPKTTYYKTNQQKKEKKGTAKLWIIMVVIIIAVVGITLAAVFVGAENDGIIYSSNAWQDDSYEEIVRDPYEYLTEELPASGTSVEYSLPSGKYVAGIHIPAGNYVAKVQDDFDVVQVWDDVNGIYLYEYEGKDEDNYLDDLRIYPGAVVTVSSKTTVTLTSENAQTEDMEGMQNPLTASLQIEGGETMTAGRDFEAGAYDLAVSGDYGQVEISIVDEQGNDLEINTLFMGTEGTDGTSYRNMVLPEGAVISCDAETAVELTPSEKIESTDYMSFYRRY